jgi:hypothetical protein
MVRSFDESALTDFKTEGNKYIIDTETFRVSVALIVYESNKNNQYMEKVNFKENPIDNSWIAVGASPVRMKDIYAMRKALDAVKQEPRVKGKDPMEVSNFEGMIPKNIIWWSRVDYKKIIWTVDPKFLDIELEGEMSGTIPIDKILFATNGENIKGFLVPKGKDFEEGDDLDQLPLPNFYGSSNMCNGSTKLATYNNMEQYLKAWENRVFRTKYSNENLGIGGIDGLKKLEGLKRLPKRFRVASNTTVEKLIEWLKV